MGIVPLDQVNLPIARILLQRLLSSNGMGHGLVLFVPDQPLQTVLLREAGDASFLVLTDTREKLAGDAYVERPVLAVRHHVDRDVAIEEIASAHTQAWSLSVAGTSPAMTVFQGAFELTCSPLILIHPAFPRPGLLGGAGIYDG